jgi:hypothetical protein
MALHKINKKRVLLLGLVIVIMAIGLLVYSGGSALVFGSDSVQDLPQGTVQLTPSVPTMGEHWANLDDMPLGPIYMLYGGEVIGKEYMYSQEMLTEIRFPIPEWAEAERELFGEEMVFQQLSNVKVNHLVDHMEIAFMPKGHEGFEVPHWDIHEWFISHALHMLIPGEAPPG